MYTLYKIEREDLAKTEKPGKKRERRGGKKRKKLAFARASVGRKRSRNRESDTQSGAAFAAAVTPGD